MDGKCPEGPLEAGLENVSRLFLACGASSPSASSSEFTRQRREGKCSVHLWLRGEARKLAAAEEAAPLRRRWLWAQGGLCHPCESFPGEALEASVRSREALCLLALIFFFFLRLRASRCV